MVATLVLLAFFRPGVEDVDPGDVDTDEAGGSEAAV